MAEFVVRLSIEERNVLIAAIDLATKAGGAQIYRDGAGTLLQSVFDKLNEARAKRR